MFVMLLAHFSPNTYFTTGTAGAGGALLHSLMKNRGPLRKPPSRFVRNLASVDFGEKEGRSLHHHRRVHHHSSNPEGAILSSSSAASGSGGSGNGSPGASSSQQSRQFPLPHQEEDESVISVDQNNDEEAILV